MIIGRRIQSGVLNPLSSTLLPLVATGDPLSLSF